MIFDALIIGSGPNGMAAAITLAQAGFKVRVYERRGHTGGGLHSAELTVPGYMHDVCSAFHPLGCGSPFFRRLQLERFGLRWIHPELPLAHPLDAERAALLHRSLEATAEGLGDDGRRYRTLMRPLIEAADELLEEILGPLQFPRRPRLMARFGLRALVPATFWTGMYFKTEMARALFAGNAAHSFLPLSRVPSGAVGLMLAVCAHAYGWPVAEGGSAAIARALEACFLELGGDIVTNHHVTSLAELPESRSVVFDVGPHAIATLAGDALPESYKKRLRAYRYGPAAFKIDWALRGAVPWTNRNCARAGTVHIGGTAPEIAHAEVSAFRGRMPERPFVLIGQQSVFDRSRAPEGGNTVWAYAHVPHAHAQDASSAIENQIERFAPGFRDHVIMRSVRTPADIESDNPNNVGGDIVGGVADLRQAFARPLSFTRPYATPNPRLFQCSAATPPGAGVHGMGGWHAAQAVLRGWRTLHRGGF